MYVYLPRNNTIKFEILNLREKLNANIKANKINTLNLIDLSNFKEVIINWISPSNNKSGEMKFTFLIKTNKNSLRIDTYLLLLCVHFIEY